MTSARVRALEQLAIASAAWDCEPACERCQMTLAIVRGRLASTNSKPSTNSKIS